MSKKKTLITIAVTAVATCIITNTVNDVLYAQNHGKVIKKTDVVTNMISNFCMYDKSDEELADASASALVSSLGDKYSRYTPKQEAEQYDDTLANRYTGIGAVITKSQDDYIQILRVNKGGPADSAGIAAGDVITAIDGKTCLGMSTTEASAISRGEDMENAEGSTIRLTIRREGVTSDIDVVRGKVAADTVYSQMLDNGIGYITITRFRVKEGDDDTYPTTYELFREQLNQLSEQGMKKLIIDVRDNPGGDLDQACKTAGMFMKQGELIAYVEDKKGARENHTADEGENITLPMAVLVNGNSASAAEAFTGALKTSGKATVIGTKTYGKGVVQTVYPMYDDSILTLTTGKYYLADGTCIHENGIEPDITVDFEYGADGSIISTSDVQLERAVAELENTQIDESDYIMPKENQEEKTE